MISKKNNDTQTHLIFVNLLIHFKHMDSQFIWPGHFAVKWSYIQYIKKKPLKDQTIRWNIVPNYDRLQQIDLLAST